MTVTEIRDHFANDRAHAHCPYRAALLEVLAPLVEAEKKEAGWTFEPAEPDVGIFGDLVIHECGTEEEAEELPVHMENRGLSFVQVTRTWRCPGCGSETTATYDEPREWFE